MATIHEVSTPCIKCEYDLFTMPPTQKHVDRGYYTGYRSISTLTVDKSPIVFSIPASSEEYIDLEQMLFFFEVELIGRKKDTKSLLTSDDGVKIVPINNFLHSMFQQVDLVLNDKVVTTSNNTYGYRAYFGNLFGTTKATKNTRLQSELWYAENPIDDLDEVENNNDRGKLVQQGKKLSMIGRLHLDLAEQQKQLLPGVNVKITLTPNKPEFYLIVKDSNVGTTIIFRDAALYVRKTLLFHQPKLAHELALTKATAKYPITRKEVRNFLVPANVSQITMDNIVSGQLPRRMIVGFVDNDSFNGKPQKNPLNFEHKGVTFIAAYIDGQQYPTHAYKPDFTKDQYMKEYYGLFQSLNQTGAETTFDITYEQYKNGFTLFGFNFSPDLSDGPNTSGHYDLIKRGNLRIEVQFAIAQPETANAIIYLEFDSLIQIDKDRNVSTDYN